MSHNAKAQELAKRLTLEEKVAFLTGFDFWNTVPNDRIGLRKLLLSDGPAGVRGEFWDERDNSANLPSGSSLGSTWSRSFAKRYGDALAIEAERKGVDVILGPTINLHRSPLGGRHFECLSEDAMLSGALATSYTIGVQERGIGACPKHYVANDFETHRYTANVTVDERTLRELYLRPFEDAVTQGKAWTIMSSYNSVNGSTVTEHDLLQTPLRSEWNFDGVVISDWTAVRTLNSAKYEQDLVMPGPMGPWGEALVEAVKSGEIAESTIDRKIIRLIELALRTGAITDGDNAPADKPRHNQIDGSIVDFAREAAVEGSVLLSNDGILPIDLKAAGKVALIGHNADAARTQGGGSATVHPKTVNTPLSALKALLGDKLTYARGAVVQEGIAALPVDQITNPVTGTQGVRVEFYGEDGSQIFAEDRNITDLIWIGSQAPVYLTKRMTFHTTFTPDSTRTELLGYASMQRTKVTVDGVEVLNQKLEAISGDQFEQLMSPPFASVAIEFEQGKAYDLFFDVDMNGREGLAAAATMFQFGFEPDKSNPQRLIDEAVAVAKAADVAIVVVGTNSKVESEGFDRKDIKLPGAQEALVEAVIAANPNTILIVNSGSPVELPFADRVRASLLTYFAGQEMGNALIEMLTGAAEPGGRLPTTWAKQLADLPVTNCTPDANMEVPYTEGIHIGYRAFLKAGTKPLYAFGHGLGYTNFELRGVQAPAAVAAGDDFTVKATVKNVGDRAGKHVVQVYARRTDSAIDRPAMWLVGFADVRVEAGAEAEVEVEVRGIEFRHWAGAWQIESGNYELLIGSASDNIQSEIVVKVG